MIKIIPFTQVVLSLYYFRIRIPAFDALTDMLLVAYITIWTISKGCTLYPLNYLLYAVISRPVTFITFWTICKIKKWFKPC